MANGDLEIVKVDGGDNLADALTKHLGAADLRKHMIGVGLEEREGRHSLMPDIAQDGDDECFVKMMHGEDEDGNILGEVQFGNGKQRGLEPEEEKSMQCNFSGIFL